MCSVTALWSLPASLSPKFSEAFFEEGSMGSMVVHIDSVYVLVFALVLVLKKIKLLWVNFNA